MFCYNPANLVKINLEDSKILVGRLVCHCKSCRSLPEPVELHQYDWQCLIWDSQPFTITVSAIVFRIISTGYGRHVSEVPLEEVVKGLKMLYASILVYDIAITLPKYSALFFYICMFKTSSKSFRVGVWVAAVLVTAWVACAKILGVFTCTPIMKAWYPKTPGECTDVYKSFLYPTVANVIIDFLIMVLPFPVIWNLQTGRSRKITLTTIFFCGYW